MVIAYFLSYIRDINNSFILHQKVGYTKDKFVLKKSNITFSTITSYLINN